jgi:dihydrofolate synthase/folylpolyglutamate synthase
LKLESLEKFGWRFGLETTQALLSFLGNPQNSLCFIHVAGSNGKGSTCAFMASFLKQSGYKPLYTHPRIYAISENDFVLTVFGYPQKILTDILPGF